MIFKDSKSNKLLLLLIIWHFKKQHAIHEFLESL